MAYQNYAGAWLPESVQGAQITGSTPYQSIHGPNANTVWGVTGDHDLLFGGTADDFYWLPNPGVTPVEQAGGGADTVEIWQSYTLPSNIENLIVFGNGQYAAGNDLDNIIKATANGDTIYGGRGEDVFIGGGGSGTTFIVAQGEGNKVIQNFTEGADTLRLIGGSLSSFSAVTAAMSQHGSDVVLNDGGTMILFRNAAINQFQAKDFQLPINYGGLGSATFSEDFNNASTIGTNWQTSFGPAGSLNSFTLQTNGEQEIYTGQNFTGTGGSPLGLNPFSFNNGVMTISATQVSAAQSAQMWNYKYSSGMVLSNFTQTYGYFEMKAELPKGQGLWPAFWLIGANQSEIDVLEALGSDTHAANTAVHAPSISPGYSNANFNPYTDGFHTYGVLWDPQHLTYYIDGSQVWQTNTPSDMNGPMRIIANLAVGGNWAGSPDASTPWPAQLQIDYIHAYALPGNGAPPPPVTTPPVTPPPVTPPPPSGGLVLTAASVGAVLTGGAGADTIYASQGNDVLTGGAGSDTFVFGKEPWSPDHITDFTVGTDKLDVSALFQASGYTGTDPVRDGYIYLASDGNGGTLVRFDRDGFGPAQQWANSIIDLEHVSPAGLTWSALSSVTSTGTPPTTPPPVTGGGGVELTATSIGATLTGGAGNDILHASQGNDVLTGGGGSNTFVFGKEPWAPDHITDFKVGSDKLDLSALLQASGYAGTDPVKDGYIYLVNDGSGGTLVRFDRDGFGPTPQWANSIIDLEHVSSAGLSWGQISGTAAPTSASGLTLTSHATGSVLVGGAGDDTLIASQASDVLSGGAGADHFVLSVEPWAPIHITDFTAGVDKLDLSALFRAAGYTGSDPIHDGWMYVVSDGNGGSLLRFDHDGPGPTPLWPNTIVDLEHVDPSHVLASDWILH